MDIDQGISRFYKQINLIGFATPESICIQARSWLWHAVKMHDIDNAVINKDEKNGITANGFDKRNQIEEETGHKMFMKCVLETTFWTESGFNDSNFSIKVLNSVPESLKSSVCVCVLHIEYIMFVLINP